ncbi:ribonuclease HII [Candidatus Microgenomates bacterium]|nr:ribonuclease HII [Candidatus Microgenomates bacterium]
MKVCGLDEAGRGALAGPLVAAAVTNLNFEIRNLKDGKLLTPKKREEIYKIAVDGGVKIIIETILAEEINQIGIQKANIKIFENLIKKITASKYIVDGNLKIEGAESIVDADATIPEVVLAGIVAKVERDKIMKNLHEEFNLYSWDENKGYGTKKHIEAINQFGSCCYHRNIFVSTALSHLPAH